MDYDKLLEATSYDPAYVRAFVELAKHGYKTHGLEAYDKNGAWIRVFPGSRTDTWAYSPFGRNSDLVSKDTTDSLAGLDEAELEEYLPDAMFDVATIASEIAYEVNRWPGRFKDDVLSRVKTPCHFELVPLEGYEDDVMPFIASFSDPKCLKSFVSTLKQAKVLKLPLISTRTPFGFEQAPLSHSVVVKLNEDVLAPLVIDPIKHLHDSRMTFIDGSELLRRYRVAVVKALKKARP